MRYRLEAYVGTDPHKPDLPIVSGHADFFAAKCEFNTILRDGITITVCKGNSDVITSLEHYPPQAITKLHILAVEG